MKKYLYEVSIMYFIYLILLACMWGIVIYCNILNVQIVQRLVLQMIFVILMMIPFVARVWINKEEIPIYPKEKNKNLSLSYIPFVVIFLLSVYLLIHTEMKILMFIKIIFFLFIAITEEYIFRGYFYQKLIYIFKNVNFGLLLAIIVETCLFTFMHVFTNLAVSDGFWIAFVNQFTVGFLLSLVRWKTRSLLMPIGLHWLLDLMNLF